VILDTNALSALADGDPAIEPALRRASIIALPVVVLGEYRYGIGQSRHRTRYERWLEAALAGFQILDIDEQTTHSYAAIRSQLKLAGRPIPANDLWIAALAKQHDLSLLSRDSHFDQVAGLDRVYW
jgi:tRNA(fMet)-specific endonuclease VapC